MKLNENLSNNLILRLSNEQHIIIKQLDSNKIYINQEVLKNASNSTVAHNAEFSKETPNQTTVEFDF